MKGFGGEEKMVYSQLGREQKVDNMSKLHVVSPV